MGNWIAGIVLAGVVITAIVYVYRAKKRGQTCIGCPHAHNCAKGSAYHNNSPCTCCRIDHTEIED